MTYQSLPQEETLLPTKEPLEKRDRARPHFVFYGICLVLVLWTGALLWASTELYAWRTNGNSLVWSPLPQNLIEHETRRFNQGMYGEWTDYMGPPSNKTEAAWEALAQHGIVVLNKKEASHLADPTIIWPDSVHFDEYIVGVEMYHQLHCLDTIRKALWDDEHFYEKEYPNEEQAHHVEHCVDYLRQVIVCHWDTGVIPFRVEGNRVLPTFNATRTCRKHEPLRDWTLSRQAGDNIPG